MSEDAAFVRTIRDSPEDETMRMVYTETPITHLSRWSQITSSA